MFRISNIYIYEDCSKNNDKNARQKIFNVPNLCFFFEITPLGLDIFVPPFLSLFKRKRHTALLEFLAARLHRFDALVIGRVNFRRLSTNLTSGNSQKSQGAKSALCGG